MITSTSNPKIKNVIQLNSKAKRRKETGAFIVEGIRMFSEIPMELVQEVYVTNDFFKKNEKLCSDYKTLEIVSDEVFMKMTDTVTPQGVIAVVKMMEYNISDVTSGDFILMLENIQDPGNLGTLFRTAEGAGVSGIIMSKGTVDVYNSKVIRSTMGSIFRMPFVYTDDIKTTISNMKKDDFKVYAAALEGAENYSNVKYQGKCALLIGNEGQGLNADTVKAATKSVFIPMAGQVESLNASISGAVLMYEVSRQRNIYYGFPK